MSDCTAILRGNRLEWTESTPEHLGKAVAVHVTILDEPVDLARASQGQRMAAALEQLAAVHALTEITDPVAWEREMRQDRVLVDLIPELSVLNPFENPA